MSRRHLLRVATALALSGTVATTLVDGAGPTMTLRTAASDPPAVDAPLRAPVDVDSVGVVAAPESRLRQPSTSTSRPNATRRGATRAKAPTVISGPSGPTPIVTGVPGAGTSTTVPSVESSGVEIDRQEGLWVLDMETGAARFHGWSMYSHARFVPGADSIVSKATWTSIDEYPLDGSAPQRLVSCDNVGCDEPEWSPDGTLLRYFDWRRSVHVVSRDGSPRHVLTLADPEHQAFDAYAFAPDGTRAASSTVEWDRIDDLGGGRVEAHITKTELRISRVDGSDIRVVQSGGRYLWLEWSPDGRYLSWRNDRDELFVMDTTNDAVRRVRIPSGPVYEVGWGSDGFYVSGNALWRFADDSGTGEPVLVDARGAQHHASKTGEVLWQRRPADGFATPAEPSTSAVTVGRRTKQGVVSTVAWIGDSWSLEVVHVSADGRYVAFFAIEPWWR